MEMNINFTVSCDTCAEHANVRFGMSNRNVQPVRFACQSCGSAIDIVPGGAVPGITGATRVQGIEPFDAETSFVDLHLDFPVSFEPYEMGMIPFMRDKRYQQGQYKRPITQLADKALITLAVPTFSRVGGDELPAHDRRLVRAAVCSVIIERLHKTV